MREIITLQCGECKNRNYTTTKNRKKHSDRMETKKFCNTCRKHTPHKEVKRGSDEDRHPEAARQAEGSRERGRGSQRVVLLHGAVPGWNAVHGSCNRSQRA